MKKILRINLLATFVLGVIAAGIIHFKASAQCVGECPRQNGVYVVFLPHRSDCTKYFKCEDGVAIMYQCQPGLHWNPMLNVCDWPENAGCE